MELIKIQNLHKSFGENHVLRGVDLLINSNQITAIIGKSGEGKSVLLKHIIRLMEPDSGDIFFKDKSIFSSDRFFARNLKSKFSYMFQQNALFDSINIFENIALPLLEKSKLSFKEIKEKVLEKMAQLDLEGLENQYPSQLSGGMQKRVAFARALITDPEIILFDEPTTGLDPIRKTLVHRMIFEYQKKFSYTAVIVSHEIPDVFYIADKIAVLNEGKIIFTGTHEEIKNTQIEEVQLFIKNYLKGWE